MLKQETEQTPPLAEEAQLLSTALSFSTGLKGDTGAEETVSCAQDSGLNPLDAKPDPDPRLCAPGESTAAQRVAG